MEVGPEGGGGQLYIDIPDSVRRGLFTMLDLRDPNDSSEEWPSGRVDAKVIGNTQISGALAFELNRRNERRYRIANQNRQAPHGSRHPAWTARNGFPAAPDNIQDRTEAAGIIADGLRIFIVKSLSGDYYAGFTEGTTMPPSWPKAASLETLFDRGSHGGLIRPRSFDGYPPVVKRIFDAWQRKPNVLLYGPAGTGKTYAMSCIWELLESEAGSPSVLLDPDNKDRPFRAIPIPSPMARDWVTFHQSYGYEDFILGLRPVVDQATSGFTLRPRAGRLLDLAVRVSSGAFREQSAVLLIDEINRGNVSRVFGEFITFMEHTYRDVDDQSNRNPRMLPVPLASVNSVDRTRERIALSGGGEVILPDPWYFPRHVYTLASMNSVDRTVAPLDSALSRRFERIDMSPDLGYLRRWLGVDLNKATAKVNANEQLTAAECAVLILDRLNYQLATTLGPDFEIGHTYLMSVGQDASDDGFRQLAVIWDQGIMPQLQERFLTRQDELIRILRIGDNVPEGYAFRRRKGMFEQEGGDRPAIEAVSLGELAEEDIERVRATFRHMASHL